MKKLISFSLSGLAVIVFFALAPLSRSAATNSVLAKTNPMASPAPTNSAPAELIIPASVFDLTAKQTKDPFFPLSLRHPVPTPTNSSPAFSPTMFTLKGLSGSADNRLALINNRTLAAGEDSEIMTTSGKVKIHLVAIKESSVVIRADAQQDPLEIFLRKTAQ